MGLFSRKKEDKNKGKKKLPPLPKEDSDRSSSKIKNELPPLPSFPSSKTGDKVSNQVAKQAIENKPKEEEMETYSRKESIPKVQQPQARAQPKEIDIGTERRTQEIEQEYSSPIKRVAPTKSRKQGQVYVKLDDFEDSHKKLKKARKEMREIEKKLKKVKKKREEEEKEIDKWEKEIDKAKSKLKKIESSIFQQ